MRCREIIEELEKTYPLSMAAGWDNSGLQAGSRDWQVKKVYIALDATDRVIDGALAAGADLLLLHHPLLFSPLKSVTSDDFTGRRLLKLLENRISCYAMHTNYDVVTMGALAGKMLGISEKEVLEVTWEEDGREKGFGCVGRLPGKMTLGECGTYVKKIFGLDTVKIFGDLQKPVSRAAVLPGSGKSMVGAVLAAKADVFITGDFGHHEGIDAVMQGLAVVDAGHYGIEHIFIGQMADYFRKTFPGLEVFSENIENPFHVL